MDETLLLWKLIDVAVWELGEAFTNLPDEAVWIRTHPKLLSIGEICLHLSHWQIKYFLPETFESPLQNEASRYYDHALNSPASPTMSATDLYSEFKRVVEQAKTACLELNPDLKDKHPIRNEMTWRQVIEYQTFHIPYHTGQIYSIRHMMGHETVDN